MKRPFLQLSSGGADRFRQPLAALVVLLLSLVPVLATTAEDITPEAYLAHVKYLASPELKGRLTGTPELNQAAEYITAQFARAHLKPLGSSYFQDFEVTARTGLSNSDTLAFEETGKSRELKQGTEFVPLNLSANGKAKGAIFFAGYGITAPQYHYDDYAGVDVQGRIVLILRHEPQENDAKSVFDGKNLTEHALFSSKVANAKLHGAKAVLIVNDLPNHTGDRDKLLTFAPLMATEDYGILVDQVSTQVAEEWLAGSHKNLQQVMGDIDRDGKPHSFPLEPAITATVVVDLKQEKRTAHNVVGYWPGQTGEYVMLGAHYDHLGTGQQDSLAPSQIGQIHPGADDNASGTAGVIELAHSLSASGVHRRGFLFLCFAGEEEGLLGSVYYAAHPSSRFRRQSR